MSKIKKLTLIFLLIFIGACKKQDNVTPEVTPPTTVPGGGNPTDIEGFQILLNAGVLNVGETGVWSIVSGLIEDKVSFSDKNKPNSIFYGMPGETYELKWTLTDKDKKVSVNTTKVTFKPLIATIKNTTPKNSTKFFFTGNKYDKASWEIEGKYARMVKNNPASEVPATDDTDVHFQGYENTNYKIKFTTHYGSKSASVTLDLKTGEYLESEALQDLRLTTTSQQVGSEGGHITRLDLSAGKEDNGMGSILIQDMERYPALQALKHLKYLSLENSRALNFPAVIGDKFLQLEELNIKYTRISSIPTNIGNLTKLKVLNMEQFEGSGVSSLPESFGKLESLQTLLAKKSGITTLPKSFNQLKELKHLEWYNQYEALPAVITSLNNLEYLDISIDGNLPASISNLNKLKVLVCQNNSVTNVLPTQFADLKSLEELTLIGGYKTLPESFYNLNLKKLTISTLSNSLQVLSESVVNLKNLEYLNINVSFNKLPESFTQLTKLKDLTIIGELKSLPADINKLQELVKIKISSQHPVNIPSSIGELRKLEELIFAARLVSLPDELFNLPKIKKLDLSGNDLSSISDEIAKLSTTLKELNLSRNKIPKGNIDHIKLLLPGTTVVN